jgi:hypothetical protein
MRFELFVLFSNGIDFIGRFPTEQAAHTYMLLEFKQRQYAIREVVQ